MNRRSILSISAMTVLGLALVPSGAVSQQKSLKDQLAGAWTLVSTEDTAANGNKRLPYGSGPKGILILDAGGRYAAVTGRADRPKLKSVNRSEVTKEEFGAAALEFAANFGTWSINEADKTLIRRYEGALVPNNEGTETRVSVSLVGDQLRLTNLAPPAGGTNVTLLRRSK
jgi:lipocalin-like protein